MGYSLVAHAAAAGTTANQNCLSATLFVASIISASGGTPTPNDSSSNIWTQIGSYENDGNTSVNVGLFYVANPTVTSSQNFGITSSDFSVLCVQAWSGSASSPLGTSSAGNSSSGSTVQPGSLTPSAANSLLVTACAPNNTNNVSSIDSSFTISDNVAYSGGVNEAGAMAYLVQSAAAAVNPSWTLDNSFGGAAIMAYFIPPSGGGGGSPIITVMQQPIYIPTYFP